MPTPEFTPVTFQLLFDTTDVFTGDAIPKGTEVLHFPFRGVTLFPVGFDYSKVESGWAMPVRVKGEVRIVTFENPEGKLALEHASKLAYSHPLSDFQALCDHGFISAEGREEFLRLHRAMYRGA